jgi:antitoxin VapB
VTPHSSAKSQNTRVHELARRAAALTGQSQTRVIEAALVRFLDDLEGEEGPNRPRARIDWILADVDRRLTDADRQALTTDALYDEVGLPR